MSFLLLNMHNYYSDLHGTVIAKVVVQFHMEIHHALYEKTTKNDN